jgi:uncharacterized protein
LKVEEVIRLNNQDYFIINQATLGKKKVHPILVLALTVVFILLGEVIGEIMMSPFHPLQTSDDNFLQAIYFSVSEAFYIAGAVLLLFLWIKVVEKRPFRSIGLRGDRLFIKYIKGMAWGLLLVSVFPVAMLVTGYGKFELQKFDSHLIWIIVLMFLASIVRGAAEEFIVRGWIFPLISVRTRTWIGLLTSSLLFGAIHLLNPGITVLSFLDVVIYAVFAALYVLKEGDIWGISGFHAIWNWAELCVFGFAMSGKTLTGYSMFKPTLTGHEMLNGGEFGLEGSIITVLVLLVASSILMLKLKKAKKSNERIPNNITAKI